MLTITTTYKTGGFGEGKIVARSNTGKQKTIPYNHALSVPKNHAEAAAALGNRVIPSGKMDQARRTCRIPESGPGRYKFTFDV